MNDKLSDTNNEGEGDEGSSTSTDASGDDPEFTTLEAARAFMEAGAIQDAGRLIYGPTTPNTQRVGKKRPGRPKGKTWGEKVTFPLDPNMLAQIDTVAEEQHSSRSSAIRLLLSEALAARKTTRTR